MSVHFEKESHGRCVELRVHGVLTRKDYEQFTPELDRLIHEKGKIDLLFEMTDFHGWGMAAVWEDLKFGIRHFRDIRRIAMVGEKKWQQWMSEFCRPFTQAEVRYFDYGQVASAREWLATETEMSEG
jgi:hypothetical protein